MFELMWVYFGKMILTQLGILTGAGLIGTSGYMGYKTYKNKSYGLSIKDLSRHMHILGDTGTGKSYRAVYETLKTADDPRRFSILWLDPNGNITPILLALLPKWRWEDVIIIDPLDTHIVGINAYNSKSDSDTELAAEDIVNIYRHIFKGNAWGQNIEDGIKYATRAVLEYTQKTNEPVNILDPYKFVLDLGYHYQVLGKVNNYVVKKFWENYNFGKEDKNGNFSPSSDYRRLLSKLSNPVESKHLLNVLAQEKGLDLVKALNERKIVIVKLGGELGKRNSTLLAGLIFIKTIRAVLSKKIKYHSFLDIKCDEMQRYLGMLGENIEESLAEIRQFRVGLSLIHQSLWQLDNFGNMKKAVGLCNTKYIFKPADEADAKSAINLFGLKDSISLKRLARMEPGRCLAIELRGGRITSPRIIKTPHLDCDPDHLRPDQIERIDKIYELSRKKYGTPRSIVEAQVNAKLWGDFEVKWDDEDVIDIEVDVKGDKDSDNRKGYKKPFIPIGEVEVY